MNPSLKPETLVTIAEQPVVKKKECDHQIDCMKMIQLVLDGEATPEQVAQISQSIGKCLPCEHGYALEKNIKEALQLRLEKRTIPTALLDSIRARVATL